MFGEFHLGASSSLCSSEVASSFSPFLANCEKTVNFIHMPHSVYDLLSYMFLKRKSAYVIGSDLICDNVVANFASGMHATLVVQ